MGTLTLLLATVAGSILAVAWVLGERPRAVVVGPWRSLVVVVGVPTFLLGGGPATPLVLAATARGAYR